MSKAHWRVLLFDLLVRAGSRIEQSQVDDVIGDYRELASSVDDPDCAERLRSLSEGLDTEPMVIDLAGLELCR